LRRFVGPCWIARPDRNAVSFARTLQGLAIITVEKLINAVLDVITKAIGTATGVAFPLPGKI
jgi:hypothetical protein